MESEFVGPGQAGVERGVRWARAGGLRYGPLSRAGFSRSLAFAWSVQDDAFLFLLVDRRSFGTSPAFSLSGVGAGALLR